MKEIKLFESWADNLVNEASEIRMGTQIKGKADRPLPREHDINYKAQLAHPELSSEQALAKYLEDELEKNEKVDTIQNKEINQIEKEVNHVEHDEDEIKAEIARLMQLIKTAQ
jgi:uncharacterized protein Yka (UPF0111/DUF47 family)